MPLNELQQEIAFGLENLTSVYQNIVRFSAHPTEDISLKMSALTYECLGYYNAAEHLMIRLLKYLGRDVPVGALSHRDTLRAFREVVDVRGASEPATIAALENLMAFRHVATKIYGFLIDRDKLEAIVDVVQTFHQRIVELFQAVLARLE
jgi:hypothetical protein